MGTVTRNNFEKWVDTGKVIAGRPIRFSEEWGEGVFWSERFDGIVSPVVAAIGGPLGYEKDPMPPRAS